MTVVYVLADLSQANRVARAGANLVRRVDAYHTLLAGRSDWDCPRGWAFHDAESAREAFGHALPAWTSTTTQLVHIAPAPGDWHALYAGVVGSISDPRVAPYAIVTSEDVATIAGHELTHHLRAFRNTPPGAEWFEEGFCFGVPRQQILAPRRLAAVTAAEAALTEAYAARLGTTEVWSFGANDDGSGWPAALYDYAGDPWAALTAFEAWNERHRHTPLAEWLGVR